MPLFDRSHLKVKPGDFPDPAHDEPLQRGAPPGLAVVAGGCFWCVEAVYRELEGVRRVTCGYSGGSEETADYPTVCTGTTDHAEVVQIEYDRATTTFGQLLKIFFSVAHDPTQLNRQDEDIGTQYRSAIFHASEEQRQIAQRYIQQLNDAQVFAKPIVTRLEPLQAFFEAEPHHQDYAARNPDQPYIAAVAHPKVEKLRAFFGDRLKSRA